MAAEPDWAAVAAAAGAEAGDVDPALLGRFLPELAAVAADGHRLAVRELARAERNGERAAAAGVPLRDLVDLYLSAAWRAWRRLPGLSGDAVPGPAVRDVGEAVLRAVDDAVAALGEGYLAGQRAVVRREESQRREFLDDLFSGTGDRSALAARGAALGVDLTGPRQVVLARAARPYRDATPVVSAVTRALVGGLGPASPDALVATRAGLLVAVLPAGATADPDRLLGLVTDALARPGGGGTPVGGGTAAAGVCAAGRRVAVGGSHPDAPGVARSFAEARDALELADRLELPDPVVRSRDLLVYTVLLRDSAAMWDLLHAVLDPLQGARGGAVPLLETIRAHADSGGNAAATARSLHLSVRAVTYRLRRVAELTGWDPAVPDQAYVLATAAIGARALGWPGRDGPG